MARYFSEQTLLDMRDKDMNCVYDLVDLEQYLAGVPAADVAPKSEVEKQKLEIWRLEGEIERLERICHSYALQYGTVTDQQKVIDKAKAEVAREIFNDLKANQIPCVSEDGAVFFCIKSKTFKQLKKKHMRATDEL